jgi:hypothetical protein
MGDPVTWCFSDLGGEIPPELGNLENLRYLNLSFNQFHGNIPEALGNLSKLQLLDLGFNRLSGNIPKELGNLQALKIFRLSSNELSGSLPGELGNLVNLEEFYGACNRLTGSIPPGLGKLKNLKYLSLAYNLLSGTIPSELGNLENLNTLELSSNFITGDIPPELGNLNQLEYLYLSINHITGSIPPGLGKLGKLMILEMGCNMISGTIPPQLGNLGELQSLDLSYNYLYGGIPQNLAQLTKLDSLNLGCNRLVGEIPPGFINLKKLSDFNVEYNGIFAKNKSLQLFLNGINPEWESTQTVAPTGLKASGIDTSSIEISWIPIRYINAAGGYKVYYRTTSGSPWTYAGMTPDKLMSSYIVSGLFPGTRYYFIVKTQTDPHPENLNTVTSESSEEVHANTLAVTPGEDQPPFGLMELPLGNGEPKSGSIAVSGWALDDVEVLSVKIYRLQGEGKVYIGDAVFVEGARPDVEQAYPAYPNNNRAGWGYLLLTNILPDSGNGYFALQATAVDHRGQETILGTKTILCDNIGSVKPFGTIDTPGQGCTASGRDFVNFGWALPSLYSAIPTDGSTIIVWVDGVPLGHPVYNLYREDIAALFFNYNNSNGAGGYFYLDTTQYENGLHTISWSVTDDAGNTDGIGSRYFTIQNTGSNARAMDSRPVGLPSCLYPHEDAQNDYPVRIIKGYSNENQPQLIYPGEDGVITVKVNELDRVEIRLLEGIGEHAHLSNCGMSSTHQWQGFQVMGSRLGALPAGSTLDRKKGIFYWQPGPGFVGEYRLVFIKKDQNENVTRKNILVEIIPFK